MIGSLIYSNIGGVPPRKFMASPDPKNEKKSSEKNLQ